MGVNFVYVEILMMFSIVVILNMMKHWTLLLLPHVMEVDYLVKDADVVFYVMVSYTVYYYGMAAGCWFWDKVESSFSPQTSVLVSLIAMGFFNFFQGNAGSLRKFILIKFFTGFSCNVNKIGAAYVHENIPKTHRKLAFLINSGSNLFGTISGPFFGQFLYSRTRHFVIACFVVSMVCFVVAFVDVLVFMRRESAREEFDADVVQPLKRMATMVELGLKRLLVHCFVNNASARSLIVLFLINSCCLQTDFVLTSLFMMNSYHRGDFALSSFQIGLGNLVSSLTGVLVLFAVNWAVPRLVSYKYFLVLVLLNSAFFTFVTPFAKFALQRQPRRVELLLAFYALKYVLCYYLYTSLLRYFIMRATPKQYRRSLSLMLNVVKSVFDGTMFNVMAPLLYFVAGDQLMQRARPFNYAVPFWALGLTESLSLLLVSTFFFPREEDYMTI